MTPTARSVSTLLLLTGLVLASGCTFPEPIPEGEPSVAFLQPTDGAIIPPNLKVHMGVEGLLLAPAGTMRDRTGHLHILVDSMFIAPGQVIPKDASHLHFGDGQSEALLSLRAGEHVLRLQFADGAHIALDGPQYRDEIRVTVVEGAAPTAVRFAAPADSAVVPATFAVQMAATGLMVEPAGTMREGSGHFHILIDTGFIAPGQVIPNDDSHRHFGTGALTAELTLEPGEHVLRLQFADGAHIALDGPQYRDEIRIRAE